jgi:AcrR family transcriptional regulator
MAASSNNSRDSRENNHEAGKFSTTNPLHAANESHASTSTHRGRPSGASPSTSREDILEAAKREFARNGYKGTTMRGVACEAGCDAKLVHYYFGSKDELFSLTIAQTYQHYGFLKLLSPTGDSPDIASIGTRFITTLLRTIQTPEFGDPYLALVRDLGTDENIRRIFMDFAREHIFAEAAAELKLDHAMERMELVATQGLGLVMLRYILKVEPIASMPIANVAALIGPTIDHYFYDDLSGGITV